MTVTANDDAVVEGAHTSNITITTASTDPTFDNVTATTPMVSDSFTEAGNTAITAHTPDTGIAWTEIYDTSAAGTDATIDAALDVVRAGSDENGVSQAYTPGPAPTGADQSISFKLSAIDTTSGTEPIGVFGRLTGTNDSYYLQILPNANSEDSLKLFKSVGGVPTELGTIDVTIAAGDTFKLEITDATKKVYHNGTEVISSTDNAVTAAGTWGFYIGATATGGDMSAAWGIDDFLAEEPSSVVVANITDNDPTVTFALSGDAATISEESAGTVNFTITLSDVIIGGNSVSIDIADVAGGAESSSDTTQTLFAAIDAALTAGVTRAGNTLTFDDTFAGPTFTFGLTASDDAIVEGTEALALQLSNPVNNNGATGITTATASTDITEVDADVTFDVSSTASISEDFTETATFTVTLGGDALTGANTASVDITPTGTAGSGVDYDDFVAALVTAAAGTAGVSFDGVDTLTFDSTLNGSGTGAFAFSVDAIDDGTLEPVETIIATLSNEAVVNGSAALGVGVTTTNVTDTDTALVSITANDPTAGEPGDNGQFTVTLTNPSSTNTVVSYTIGGSATPGAGNDYTTLSGTVTILAGATTAVIDVTVLDDSVLEVTEGVLVTLTGITAGDADAAIDGANAVATVTITDDDTALVSIAATTPASSPPPTGQFTVTMTNASATDTTLSYTVGGSVRHPGAGNDYTTLSGTVTILAGDTTSHHRCDGPR